MSFEKDKQTILGIKVTSISVVEVCISITIITFFFILSAVPNTDRAIDSSKQLHACWTKTKPNEEQCLYYTIW
jgi:hypothetical protein